MNKYWRMIPLFIFFMMAGLFWRGLSLNPRDLPSAKIGHSLPSFILPSLEDGSQKVTSQQWLGKLMLLNVWASWCMACEDEQPFLMHLAQEGIPIYGLNYKDTPEAARQWINTWGNPYQMIGLDKQGRVGIELGVYGTPETFLIDPKGIIRYRFAGVLNQEVWEHEFAPRIAKLGLDRHPGPN